LQNFYEILYIMFDKRSENVQTQRRVSIFIKYESV